MKMMKAATSAGEEFPALIIGGELSDSRTGKKAFADSWVEIGEQEYNDLCDKCGIKDDPAPFVIIDVQTTKTEENKMGKFIVEGFDYRCGEMADIAAGIVLPGGDILTGRIGCFYEGCDSGYISSNLGEVVAIIYKDGYCYAEIED